MAAGIDEGGYRAPSAAGHAPRPRYSQRSEAVTKPGVSAWPGGDEGDDEVAFFTDDKYLDIEWKMQLFLLLYHFIDDCCIFKTDKYQIRR